MKSSAMILITMGLIAFTLTKEGITADDSMVLYLSFDEGKGKEVKDGSIHGNDGKLEGGTKWIDGKYGKAVAFEVDGDHVTVESSDSLKIGKQITLMAWGRIDAWVGDGDQWIDKGAHASKPNCYGMMVYQKANAYFMLGDGAARHDLITPNMPKTGEWHHVACIYDGKTMTLYVNGEVAAEKQEAFAFNGVNDLPLMVGMGVDRAQYTFSGAIDEVAVFNRALDKTEVNKAMAGLGKMLSVEHSNKIATTWGLLKGYR